MPALAAGVGNQDSLGVTYHQIGRVHQERKEYEPALEWYGTGVGAWTWAPVLPLLGLPAGNPPACIGAGYAAMDALTRRIVPRTARILAGPPSVASSAAPARPLPTDPS